MHRAPSGIQIFSGAASRMSSGTWCMPLVHDQVLSAKHRCTARQVSEVHAVPGHFVSAAIFGPKPSRAQRARGVACVRLA
eukprot:14769231-Alexandrium_andersonii.AAC.1